MRTEGLAILSAVVLHAGILLVARAMPPLSLLKPSDRRELRIIEIELPASLPEEVRAPTPQPQPVEPTQKQPDAERPPEARVASRAAPTAPEPPGRVEPGPVSPETNPQPAPTHKPDFDELPPDDRQRGVLGVPGVPGLGGPVWSMPGVLPDHATASAPAPTVAPAPRPVDKDIAGKVIRDAMASRDKELGIELPASGRIRTTVANVVRGSDVPDSSRGSIECRISAGGQVTGCRAVSMSGGSADQWDRVAKQTMAQLAGQTLELNSQYAQGAVVTVGVISRLQAPSGSKGGFSGTGASFDVSNIGAHATRNVSTSVNVATLR